MALTENDKTPVPAQDERFHYPPFGPITLETQQWLDAEPEMGEGWVEWLING